MQNPLCATDGIGDEKCRFLGFRTFAASEKGPPTPLFQSGSGPGRLWSEAATLTRACRVALGGPSPRTPPEKVRAEGSRERRRGSRDSRRDVALFLKGIQRVAFLRFCFFTFSRSRAGAQKRKSALFEKRFSLPVRAARTEREKRARRQRLARAKGHAAVFVLLFRFSWRWPYDFLHRTFFHEIPPRMKRANAETALV